MSGAIFFTCWIAAMLLAVIGWEWREARRDVR